MKNYTLTFLLAVLVVLASVRIAKTLYGANAGVAAANPAVAIGPSPFPYPPAKVNIGPSPFPYPPARVAIGPSPFPYPPAK